jgi:hypothetical protein
MRAWKELWTGTDRRASLEIVASASGDREGILAGETVTESLSPLTEPLNSRRAALVSRISCLDE